MPQQVDYAALASQFGGRPVDAPAVDYAALAQQFGGRPAQAPRPEQAERPRLMPAHGPAQPVLGIPRPVASHEPPRQRTVLGRPVPSDMAAQFDVAEENARGRGRRNADLVAGAQAGLLSTAFHGGDLIRRATGMERVIDTPEAQEAMTPPPTTAGKVGFYGEQIAEFAAPLARATKAASALSLPRRMAVEGATGAAVSGVQSGGDADSMMTAGAISAAVPGGVALVRGGVGAAQRAAAGAQDGGVPGAIAGLVRTVAPPSSKAMVVQAIKPRSTRVQFDSALDVALPEVKAAEAALGRPINNLADMLDATKLAKRNIWAQYEQVAGPMRAMGAQVDTSPVADAVIASIPRKLQARDPQAYQRMVDDANRIYRRTWSVEDTEAFLKETNAELEAYFNKYPAARNRAVAANPEIAATVAEGVELRAAIYRMLDAAGEGQAPRELKRRYGALLELEDTAIRRQNVANRQQPVSLSEQIAGARAAGDVARGAWRLAHGDLFGAADIVGATAMRKTASYLREQQTTDALIRRAFQNFRETPSPVAMPQRPTPRGFLGPGARPMGPAPDPSFVRGVPAQPARHEVRGLLPPGQTLPSSGRVHEMPGDVQPDASFVRGVPAEYGAKWEPPAPPPQQPVAAPPATAAKPRAARVTRTKTATAKSAAPAAAAEKVIAQVEKVIDTRGAKSAADVQRRVMVALEEELEGARQANKFGDVEVRPRKAYGGREFDVWVGGEPVVSVDRFGEMEAHYSVSDELLDALGASRPQESKYGGRATLGSLDDARNMTPSEMHRRAHGDIAKRLSRASGAGTITVRIPGDGTITVERNPYAIQAVLNRIKGEGASPWSGLSEGKTPPKPTADDAIRRAWKPTW